MFDRTPESSEPRILAENTPDGPDHPHPVYVPLLPDPEGLLAAGSAPARIFRLKRRQDPTDDRRAIYRAGSTTIRPRPRLSR